MVKHVSPACRRWLSKHICVFGTFFFHLLFTHVFFFFPNFTNTVITVTTKEAEFPLGDRKVLHDMLKYVFFVFFVWRGSFYFFHFSAGNILKNLNENQL